MSIFVILALLQWAVAFGITLWGTLYALRRFTTNPKVPTFFPPISVLKPVKGIDPGLSTNLESFFHLNYPEYELLFCVACPTDPALPILRELVKLYPSVQTRLFVGEECAGINPKINNMMQAYREAKYDAILISDSNVRVGETYLTDLIPHLSEKNGMVTSVVSGVHAQGIGGHLEATYLNTFFARWMHVAAAFGYPAVVGKSMFFLKSTIERFGGLKALSGYVAEDYMAGHAIKRLGLNVAIMHTPVPQFIGEYSFQAFWSRHIRWGRIRKSIAPMAFFTEPMFGAVFSAITGAFAFSHYFHVSQGTFLTFHLITWFICDGILMQSVGECKIQGAFAWAARELLAIPMWAYTLFGDKIHWRGKEFRILPGGILEHLNAA